MTSSKKNWIAFLFGLGSVTYIRVIGAMTITEAVCIWLTPFLLKRYWSKLKETKGNRLLGWMLLWSLSAIITDVYRETSFLDAIKGIFVLPFLFSMFLCSFALLWDDLNRVKWIALGMAISANISIFYFRPPVIVSVAERLRTEAGDLISFKNTYSAVLLYAVFVMTLVLYKKRPRIVVILLLVFSGLYLQQGFRNGFITLFLSGIGAWTAKSYFTVFRSAQKRLPLLVISLAVIIIAVTAAYSYSAKQGWLGDEELSKFERQSQSEIGLLSGRGEFFAAMLIVADSPIIGLGSWARDRQGYYRRYFEMVGDRNSIEVFRHEKGLPLAPSHSHIMQAWVWHGFFGGFFWMVVIYMIYRYFRYALHLCRHMIAYNLLLLTTAMWNILFSPFGQRINMSIVLTVLVFSLAEVERRKRKQKAGMNIGMNEPWNGKWSQ